MAKSNNNATNNNATNKRGESTIMSITQTKAKVKRTAAIAIAIMALFTIVAAIVLTTMVPSVGDHFSSHATANTIATNTETTTTTVIKADEIEVIGLVDRSGSMNNWGVAVPSADKTVVIDGSKILTGIKGQLDAGVQRLIVVTDCESYDEDTTLLNNSHYENIEIVFYVPATASDADVQAYKTIFTNVLNNQNSTLAFFMENGKDVVFNNFVPEGDGSGTTTETTTNETPVTIDVVTEHEAGNSIPWVAFIWIIEGFIILCSIFAEVILAIAGDTYVNIVEAKEKDDDDDEPVEVIKAVNADEVLMDGSGSVESVYGQFVEYCKKYQVNDVVRFASNVEEMDVDTAENTPAGGTTAGWKAIKHAIDSGAKKVTIVSDFDFDNDSATEAECMQHAGVFDEVFWVHGPQFDQQIVDKIKTLAKNNTEVDITAALNDDK